MNRFDCIVSRKTKCYTRTNHKKRCYKTYVRQMPIEVGDNELEVQIKNNNLHYPYLTIITFYWLETSKCATYL